MPISQIIFLHHLIAMHAYASGLSDACERSIPSKIVTISPERDQPEFGHRQQNWSRVPAYNSSKLNAH
jgi:hypothetical protein